MTCLCEGLYKLPVYVCRQDLLTVGNVCGSQDYFKDPVRAEDGYLYERSSIMQCIEKHGPFSPITTLPLTIEGLQESPATLVTMAEILSQFTDDERQQFQAVVY